MSAMHEALLPPQDLAAERSVLGSILLYGQCLDEVSQVLTDSDFYLDCNNIVYRAVQSIAAGGSGGIDVLTVSDELERIGKLDEIGGNAYLTKLVESVPHAGHAKFHAGIVRGKSIQRQLIYLATDIMREAYGSHVRPEDLLQDSSSKVLALLESKSSRSGQSIREAAIESFERYTSPIEPGVDLGFSGLRELFYATEKSQLMIIGARPGVGKSALVGNIMRRFANREPVFMASIEMTLKEVFDRLMCSELGVSPGELRSMANNDHNSDEVDEARNIIAQLPIVIDDSTQQSVSSIAAQCRLMQKKQGLGLVIVDYLQLVVPDNKRESREQQVGKIAWDLKCLAKNLDVPVIALAQLNRDIEKRPDKRPRMSDLRESGAIEQHAGKVMFLDRPGLWDPEKNDPEKADLYVDKNRGGKPGKVDLIWHGRSATFKEPEHLPAGFSADEYPMDQDFV